MTAPWNVFAPAKLGPVTLRNRIIKAATFEARTPDALVTDDLIEYHRLPAAGGVGMTTLGCCAVSPGGRTPGKPIWMRPEAAAGLRRLAEAVHAEGAAVSVQIGHAGPVADARSNEATALAPVRFFNPLGMRFAKKATRDDRYCDSPGAGGDRNATCGHRASGWVHVWFDRRRVDGRLDPSRVRPIARDREAFRSGRMG